MTGQEGKPAKVSLARITIDAPPGKVIHPPRIGVVSYKRRTQTPASNADRPLQVYQKLAQVGAWNNWHTSAWVLRSPGLEKLVPGEKFAYTAPFVCWATFSPRWRSLMKARWENQHQLSRGELANLQSDLS